MAVSIYIPINSAQVFCFPHILTSTFDFLLVAIPTGMKFLIYSSLIICVVEHLLKYLLTICVFFEEVSIRVLCPFLNLEKFLDINSLSYICFAKVFPFCRLPFHLIDCFPMHIFEFGVVPIVYFCFCCLRFLCLNEL